MESDWCESHSPTTKDKKENQVIQSQDLQDLQDLQGLQVLLVPAGSSGSATISNNADNRVITGGTGTNLNAEQNLTFDGST